MSNYIEIIIRKREHIPAVYVIFGTNGDDALQDKLLYFALEMYDYARVHYKGSLFRDKYRFFAPFKYSVSYSMIFPNEKNLQRFILFLKRTYSN